MSNELLTELRHKKEREPGQVTPEEYEVTVDNIRKAEANLELNLAGFLHVNTGR